MQRWCYWAAQVSNLGAEVVSRQGTPRRVLVLSASGLAPAAAMSVFSPERAFPMMWGLALFGALVTWLLIFASELAFRRRRRSLGLPRSPVGLPDAPYATVLAMVFVAAVLVTAAFTEQFGTAWKPACRSWWC